MLISGNEINTRNFSISFLCEIYSTFKICEQACVVSFFTVQIMYKNPGKLFVWVKINNKVKMWMFIVSLLAYSKALPTAEVRNFTEDAVRILNEVPLIDGHNDLPWNLQLNFDGQLDRFDLEEDICELYVKNPLACHTDIPRLREGIVGAQFWAVYTKCHTQYKDGTERALEIIDLIKRFTREYSYFFRMAYSVQDILDNHAAGLLSSLMGIEGGHMVEDSLGVMRMFYELGARYLTLTHNCNTPWADQNRPDNDAITPPNGGLTDWGRALVREMNRLGMLVDLSHVSHQTMLDALNVTIAPVMFSHSSAYAICPHNRNVPDNVLLRVQDNGGIVMIVFYNNFVNCTEDNRYDDDPRTASLDQVIDHMDHIRDLIGVDYIGLGSDYDGVHYTPDGLEDTSKFPNLVARMLERGYTEEDVKKIVNGNFLRVFTQVEQIRDQLQNETEDDTLPDYDAIPDLSCSNLPEWDVPGGKNSAAEDMHN